VTVHERPVGATVEWYTPPSLFDALGLTFDLDPAAPRELPAWIPARHSYHTARGELRPWFGRVWLNPPYGRDLPKFVDRMCDHRHGLMLVPARTETAWWQQAAHSADMVVFLRDRLHFIRDDGYQARASFGSCLFAWGDAECEAVVGADLGFTHVGQPR
jgi:hypothetical protein